MTMDPNAPPTGFMGGVQNTMQTIGQGLGNLFPGYRDAPRQGGETDPFTGLSRNQRMMLGFAALRDAAASLQGEQSDFFTSALGGFEQGRERERLRAQGIFQNQVQGLQALGALRQQINLARAYGQDASGLEAMYAQLEALVAGGGSPATAAIQSPTYAATANELPIVPDMGQPQVSGAGGADEMRPQLGVEIDAAGNIVGTYTGEETPSAPEATPAVAPEVAPSETPAAEPATAATIAELEAQRDEIINTMNAVAASGQSTAPLNAQLASIDSELEAAREALREQQQQAVLNEDAAVNARDQIALLTRLSSAPTSTLETILGPYQGALDPTNPMAGMAERISSGFAIGDAGTELLGIIRQIQGDEFLAAFNALRGGGQITQIEGERALAARSRLNNRQVSPEAYRQAIEEIIRIHENALARAEGRTPPHEITASPESPPSDDWIEINGVRIRSLD